METSLKVGSKQPFEPHPTTAVTTVETIPLQAIGTLLLCPGHVEKVFCLHAVQRYRQMTQSDLPADLGPVTSAIICSLWLSSVFLGFNTIISGCYGPSTTYTHTQPVFAE